MKDKKTLKSETPRDSTETDKPVYPLKNIFEPPVWKFLIFPIAAFLVALIGMLATKYVSSS
jgi:hypothetical protein